MREQMEEHFYHTLCSISKICKRFFYDRKYLPRDTWHLENIVEEMKKKVEQLETQYNVIKEEE